MKTLRQITFLLFFVFLVFVWFLFFAFFSRLCCRWSLPNLSKYLKISKIYFQILSGYENTQTWLFSTEKRNSAVFPHPFFNRVFFFFFFRFLLFSEMCFCSFSFQNSFNFHYSNFYSWTSFICLIYLSLPNLYFYTLDP